MENYHEVDWSLVAWRANVFYYHPLAHWRALSAVLLGMVQSKASCPQISLLPLTPWNGANLKACCRISLACATG
jgi:hypothetical protein